MRIALLVALFAVALPAQDERESWSLPEVRQALESLPVMAERDCGDRSVPSSAWSAMLPAIADLHGGLFSAYDGLIPPSAHYVQIEHVVARKEADESGLCGLGIDVRREFAADLLNLTLAPGALNASKGARDVGEVAQARTSLFRETLTSHGRCWWAAQSVRVKSKHGLSVDADEKAALVEVLDGCTEEEVKRPVRPLSADWQFREEYLAELDEEQRAGVGACADPADENEVRVAVNWSGERIGTIACVDEPEEDPAESQTESATGP